jgi:hypothetical protein
MIVKIYYGLIRIHFFLGEKLQSLPIAVIGIALLKCFTLFDGLVAARAENGPGRPRAGSDNSNVADGPTRAELPKSRPGPVRFQ